MVLYHADIHLGLHGASLFKHRTTFTILLNDTPFIVMYCTHNAASPKLFIPKSRDSSVLVLIKTSLN